MALFFAIQLIPIGYAALYIGHSVRQKRRGQAIAVGALVFLNLCALSLLAWEFLALP